MGLGSAKRRHDRAGGPVIGAYDERCAADLESVGEGRGLSREDRAWLARAATGAMRPNRDKPLWDLAHALLALATLAGAREGRDLVTLALDPRLARSEALARRFPEVARDGVLSDGRGLVLLSVGADRPAGEAPAWRIGWAGLSRTLALAEFLITAEDLAHFGTVVGWLDELTGAGDLAAAGLLARRLARHLAAYRNVHLPLATVERQFRAILDYLGGRADFSDDDIVGFWRSEIAEGERPGFRTVAEHFVTFDTAAAALSGLQGLREAASLDDPDGPEERIEAAIADVVGTEPAASLLALIEAIPDGPKILTGVERDELSELLRLDPFHRTRSLTALRSASFGRVQSGLANRLRRGVGGRTVADRVDCAEAESYGDLSGRIEALGAHLDRMIRIAASLRLSPDALDPGVRAALQAAETDRLKLRRAGFEDRQAAAVGFAAADETLLRLREELAHLARGIRRFASRTPLDEAFAADKVIFSQALAAAYSDGRAA